MTKKRPARDKTTTEDAELSRLTSRLRAIVVDCKLTPGELPALRLTASDDEPEEDVEEREEALLIRARTTLTRFARFRFDLSGNKGDEPPSSGDR